MKLEDGPLLRVARAEHQLQELERAVEPLRDSNNYSVIREYQLETGTVVFKAGRVPVIPSHISLLTGEILHNLRSALDNLAFALVCSNRQGITYTEAEKRHIYFPIYNGTSIAASFDGKVMGMSEAAKDLIRSLKPYRGGNDDLWRLHMLNIRDKHRMLITAAVSNSVNILSTILAKRPDLPPHIRAFFVDNKLFTPPHALKEGSVLFTDTLDQNSEYKHKPEIAFDIALYEPGVVFGEPLMGTLRQLASSVQEIIELFRPLFSVV